MALLCALTLFSFGPFAGTADAAIWDEVGYFNLQPCNVLGSTWNGYGEWSGPSGGYPSWSLTARCPSDVELQVGDTRWIDGRWTTWDFPSNTYATNPIVSVSFDLKGGDGSEGGLEQAFAVCNGDTCSVPIHPVSASQSAVMHYALSAAEGDFPAGANHVRLMGRCVAGSGCTSANPLHVQNLDIVLSDDVAPEIKYINTPLNYSEKVISPWVQGEPKTWNVGKRRFNATATDAGSGVQRILYEFRRPFGSTWRSSAFWWNEEMKCGFSDMKQIGYVCPRQLDQEFVFDAIATVLPFNIGNGPNELAAYAHDAAGNVSEPVAVRFLVDSVSPIVGELSPSTGYDEFWQPENLVGVKWSNIGETIETGSASGLAGARWRVYQRNGKTLVPNFEGRVNEGVVNSIGRIDLPGDGIWVVSVSTFDRAGNEGAEQRLSVGVDSTVLDAPEFEEPPEFGSEALSNGASLTWRKPANANDSVSGICGYAVAFDDDPTSDPGLRSAIYGDETSVRLPGPNFLPNGLSYVHMRAITCAGIGGRIAHMALTVDKEPPQIVVSDPGPDGWYSEAHKLHVSLSPVAEAGSSIALAYDDGVLTYVDLPALDAPLIDGVHRVEIRAKDALGNVAMMVIPAVKIDTRSPTIELAPRDPARPVVVNAFAKDDGSGVAAAWLQYAAEDGEEWHTFGDVARATDGAARSVQVSARFPDSKLSAGRYRVRLAAVDSVGNRSISTGSGIAELTLPLRRKPVISAGFSVQVSKRIACSGRSRKAKARCKRSSVKKFFEMRDHKRLSQREQATLQGSLRDADGNPIADAKIEIFEAILNRQRSLLAAVQTDADGDFRFLTSPGPSRRVIARFEGSEVDLPSGAEAQLLVRPTVRLRVALSKEGRRTKAILSGRITALSEPFPASGLVVTFEHRSRRGRQTFPAIATAGANGHFTVSPVFPVLKKALVFNVRAKVARADGWPFESGLSNTVRIEVR